MSPQQMVCLVVPFWFWPAISCTLLFLALVGYVLFKQRGSNYFYFDPQDFAKFEDGGGRKLPVAAETATFATHLENYIGVMKLLITVAAASIAFGTTTNVRQGVLIAKIILAFAILYGVVFSGLLVMCPR